MFASCSMAPGWYVVSSSDWPLTPGFYEILGAKSTLIAVTFITQTFPLLSGNFLYTFGFSTQLYALARSGYLPSILSETHKQFHTPYIATIAGSTVGYAIAMIAFFCMSHTEFIMESVTLLTALINYVLLMVSFIIMRTRYSQIEKPFQVPFGVPLAAIALISCVIAFMAVFIFLPFMWPGLLFIGAWLGAGLAYYLYARTRLRFSPEESFAFYCLYNIKHQRALIKFTTHKNKKKPKLNVKVDQNTTDTPPPLAKDLGNQ